MEEKKYLNDGKIDTSEEGIIYWSYKIKCDPKDLKKAVSIVGESYNILVLYLELNRQIKKE